MIIDFITFSARGASIAILIKKKVEQKGNIVRIFTYSKLNFENTIPFSDVTEKVGESIKNSDGIVFISSTAVAIKAMAPFINRSCKMKSVVALDEDANYSVSLLSAMSDKNENLANIVAQCSGAVPVITTQSENGTCFDVNAFINDNMLRCDNNKLLKEIKNDLLAGERIGISTPFSYSSLPDNVTDSDIYPFPKKGICIDISKSNVKFDKTLFLFPKAVTLGIIFKGELSEQKLENNIFSCLSENKIPLYAIEAISTTMSRRYEKGINNFCSSYHIPLSIYSPEEISELDLSDIETEITNLSLTDKLALINNNGNLVFEEYKSDVVRISISVRDCFLVF